MVGTRWVQAFHGGSCCWSSLMGRSHVSMSRARPACVGCPYGCVYICGVPMWVCVLGVPIWCVWGWARACVYACVCVYACMSPDPVNVNLHTRSSREQPSYGKLHWMGENYPIGLKNDRPAREWSRCRAVPRHMRCVEAQTRTAGLYSCEKSRFLLDLRNACRSS